LHGGDHVVIERNGKTMRKINAIEIGPEDFFIGMDGKSTMKQSAVEAIRMAELVVSIQGELIKSRSAIVSAFSKSRSKVRGKESVEDKAKKMANVRKAIYG